jgi:hypothetical protein
MGNYGSFSLEQHLVVNGHIVHPMAVLKIYDKKLSKINPTCKLGILIVSEIHAVNGPVTHNCNRNMVLELQI